jgi:hypothetical protein
MIELLVRRKRRRHPAWLAGFCTSLATLWPVALDPNFTSRPNSMVTLAIDADPNWVGQIEVSTDLSDWSFVTPFTNISGRTDFVEPATRKNARFYRGRVHPLKAGSVTQRGPNPVCGDAGKDQAEEGSARLSPEKEEGPDLHPALTHFALLRWRRSEIDVLTLPLSRQVNSPHYGGQTRTNRTARL